MNEKLNSVSKSNSKNLIHDLIILLKPELTGLSVFTTIFSGIIALDNSTPINYSIFLFLGFGTLFVGGGAGVLNQYIERALDAKMKRTEKRPIPDNRILPNHALSYGIIVTIIGFLLLQIFVNTYSFLISFATWAIYIFIYTPLKRISVASTVVGAIPGALPTLIGWVGIKGEITVEGWILFLILFFWQMPHFYSLAWMYRNDYAKADFQILSVVDKTGTMLSRQIIFNTILLLAVSFYPYSVGMATIEYFYIGLVLNLIFLAFAFRFSKDIKKYNLNLPNDANKSARKLFFVSLIYLPIIFILIYFFER